MNNSEQTAELLPSASIAQSNMLGEERTENTAIPDEQIEDFVVKLMKENPVKFVQYALVIIGRDIFQTNATDFTFSQESDLEKGRRFKITVEGTIKEIIKK